MEEKEEKKEKGVKEKKLIALKDFVICHNEYHIKIKKGDVVKVPKLFIQNLITECVIKK